MGVSDYLSIVEESGRYLIQCRCGHRVCDADKNYKEHVLLIESPLTKISPLADISGKGFGFVFREFCCPNCATLLGTEVSLKDDPILHDIELKVRKSQEG